MSPPWVLNKVVPYRPFFTVFWKNGVEIRTFAHSLEASNKKCTISHDFEEEMGSMSSSKSSQFGPMYPNPEWHKESWSRDLASTGWVPRT